VRYAEPDYVVKAALEPNDPRYGSLWGMQAIQAPLAWNVTTGDTSVKVCVIDEGIAPNHEDLSGE
jgi:thermitase